MKHSAKFFDTCDLVKVRGAMDDEPFTSSSISSHALTA